MRRLFAVLHGLIWTVLLSNVVYLWRRKKKVPKTWPSLSVLIPARNEEGNIQRLLTSLNAQRYEGLLEVIVYDDGSEDATAEQVERFVGMRPERYRLLRGEGPPAGWIGKVHALYQATRHASGDVYLFLDADAALLHAGALRKLVERHEGMRPPAVLTGLTALRGGGKMLVSLVPNAILAGLPWSLARLTGRRMPSLGALNGQCWMLRSDLYHHYEPHAAFPDEVLEDVTIGRYLKRHGVVPVLADVQQDLAVYMYPSFGEAWRGFRKNAYLLMGGTSASALGFTAFFALCFVAPLRAGWRFAASLFGMKLLTDRLSGFPLWVSALAPVSSLLGVVLQIDSMVSHLLGRVAWKGRPVSRKTRGSGTQPRPISLQPRDTA